MSLQSLLRGSGFLATVGVGLACCALAPATHAADSVADFYHGKSIHLIIGAAVAGAYDVAGRALASHLARHIPGNPTIVIENMPGATSLIMTNYVYNSAPRDGTVIGMPNSNVPLEPRLKLLSRDGGNVKFDLGRVSWLGTPTQEPQVLWVWHDVADRIEDLKTHKILVGSTGAGADNYTLPVFTRQLLGADIGIVTGYNGQDEIDLAVERGEVQGNSTSISNLTVGKADWMRDKKVHILLQFGTKRLDSLADVPTAMELATKDIDREMLGFYALKFNLARPLMLPPDVPGERVEALQRAFDETMKDPLFLAEAAKLGLDIDPLSGPAVAHTIDEINKTPQEVVDRVRQLLDDGTK